MKQPSRERTSSDRRRGRVRRGMFLVLGAYLGVILLLAFLENSLVYPAPPRDAGEWSPPFQFEDVRFASADGTQLHGWLLPAAQPTDLWIVYFHGNGDQVSFAGGWLDSLRRHVPANIFVFDYRGYGRSEGTPSEDGVLADGEAAVQWVAERAQLRPGQLALMGRSLGGAVAVHIAAKHDARGVVLERTFTRMTDAAKARYWWIPVSWMMRNRYHSVDKIPDYSGPLLCSHGDCDRLIPHRLGLELYRAAGTPDERKQFITIKETGHNGPDSPEYQAALLQFLRSLPPIVN